MTSIIEKRVSLHRHLTEQQQQNATLKSQISQLQALANIGTSMCMIAHEINNLLTPLASYATVALNDPGDKGLTEKALKKTVRNCERASEVMESILAMVNGETQEKKDVRVNALVEEIFRCLCRDFSKDGITVEIRVPEELTVWAVPVQIQQVLMNLILNARDAMLPRGGILTIKAQDANDSIQIEVCDTGCGIEPDDLEKIFEPFFSAKTDKKLPSRRLGSGLGLAFCKEIVDSHKGYISVESTPAKGSKFEVVLPKRGKVIQKSGFS